MTFRKHASGFSLVELLVVITIMAILSVTAYVALGGQTAKARNSKRMQDLGAIQSAIEIYALNNGNKYPAALDDGNTTDPETDLVPKYMPKLPKDPSKNASGGNFDYAYGFSTNSYQLGTTLEEDNGTFKAYVIGNGVDLINGVAPSGCGKVTDGGTCLPYSL